MRLMLVSFLLFSACSSSPGPSATTPQADVVADGGGPAADATADGATPPDTTGVVGDAPAGTGELAATDAVAAGLPPGDAPPVADAVDSSAPGCACAPSSCGKRTCGRSACGGANCGPLDYCQLCAAPGAKPTATCHARAGSKPMCPKAGDLTFDAFCDGHDDCAGTDRCTAVRGDFTRLTCEPAAKTATCDGSLLQQACKDVGQCPPCAKACNPSTFADQQTPTGYGVGVCK